MMMGGDRKKTASLILGPDPRDHKEPEGEIPSALHECVSELMDAFKGDDVAGAVEALRSFIAEVKSEPQEE